MFIQYEPPAEGGKTSRRKINTFIAAQAAKKRRKQSKLASRMETFWVQQPETQSQSSQQDDGSSSKDQSGQSSEQSKALARSPPMTLPFASGKFYPINNVDSKGPSTTRALSYYFEVILPHDSKALGHGSASSDYYASVLLNWSNTCDAILHGLSAFTLCNLEAPDPTGATRAATLYHRKKLFDAVTDMLSRQVVNDHLIQAICLLIPVDDYLGYVDYSRAHLDGLSTVVRLRGGHNKVGQSVKGMGPNLQTSLLVVKSLLISHMQTSLNPEHLPSPPTHSHHATRAPTPHSYAGTHPERTSGTQPNPNQPLTLPLRHQVPSLNILPPAFHILIRANAITTPAIEILLSFSTWLTTHRQKQAHLIPVWRHQSTTPLTAIEKCLFAALLCLADDLSGMGVHPAAIIFRQPKKRAEMLLSVREFWTDPMLSDLVIWLSMVVTAPRNAGITPWGVQRELFRRIILGRPDLRGWADVRGVLQGFFFEEGRAGVWQVVWGEMVRQTLGVVVEQ